MRKQQKSKILVFDSYKAAILGSVGTPMFQHLYVRHEGSKKDVTKAGDLSCALYVSSILVMFKLIATVHATVHTTVHDMDKSGWKRDTHQRLAQFLFGRRKMATSTLGFTWAMGGQSAIVQKKESPTRHHWTFGTKGGKPKRRVESIWWTQKLNLQDTINKR